VDSRRPLFFVSFLLLLGNFVSALAQAPDSQRNVFDSTAKPSAPEEPGPYYALVIGINEYEHLTKLKSPLNDANDVASLLHDRYGFQTTLLPNATRHEILSALDNYRRTLPDDSNLLIYYAGHGWYDEAMDKAYWAPAEAERDTYADWIMADEITGRARAIPARHILIVSDSCYSGMIAAYREDNPRMSPVRRGPYLDKCLRKKSRAVISSGGNEPVTDAGAPGHSIFTYAFLQGLKEIEWDEFSANDLFDQYVNVQVAGKSDQMPTFRVIRDSGDDFGDFVFSKVPVPVTAQPAAAASAAAQPKVLLAQAKALRTGGDQQGSAFTLFRQAAEGGNAEAMTYVGLYYDPSKPAYRGVPKDNAAAAAWYLKAAAAGDPLGMSNVAVMYRRGWGVPKDEVQAVNWYRKAADLGSADGMVGLGWMYRIGSGVAHDDAQAVTWYRRAAEAGSPTGMVNLGFMYQSGLGVAKDEVQAVFWYRTGAEAGSPGGMFNLGLMYEQGTGLEKDEAQAVAWYRRAAEAGDVKGMVSLGLMYCDGKGVSQDDAQAVSWYRKAGEAGDTDGMVRLGWMYDNGRGVTKDDAQAVNWYRKAAEAGNVDGMNCLGVMYRHGKGVAQNDSQAVSLFRKAAEAGNALAMRNLGLMYENGWGVEKDHAQAVSWYGKAAKAGDELAMKRLKKLGIR